MSNTAIMRSLDVEKFIDRINVLNREFYAGINLNLPLEKLIDEVHKAEERVKQYYINETMKQPVPESKNIPSCWKCFTTIRDGNNMACSGCINFSHFVPRR
jgi:hypothetical protein